MNQLFFRPKAFVFFDHLSHTSSALQEPKNRCQNDLKLSKINNKWCKNWNQLHSSVSWIVLVSSSFGLIRTNCNKWNLYFLLPKHNHRHFLITVVACISSNKHTVPNVKKLHFKYGFPDPLTPCCFKNCSFSSSVPCDHLLHNDKYHDFQFSLYIIKRWWVLGNRKISEKWETLYWSCFIAFPLMSVFLNASWPFYNYLLKQKSAFCNLIDRKSKRTVSRSFTSFSSRSYDSTKFYTYI